MPRKPKSPRTAPEPDGLPTREQILDFLGQAKGKAGKREIARAFSIKGGARIALKRLLAEMADEGLLAGGKKEMKKRGSMNRPAIQKITKMMCADLSQK